MVEMVSLMMFVLLIVLVIGFVLYLVSSPNSFLLTEQIQEKMNEPLDISWVYKILGVLGKIVLYALVTGAVVVLILGIIFAIKQIMTYRKYQKEFLYAKDNWVRIKKKVDFLSEMLPSNEEIKKMKENVEILYKEILKLKIKFSFSVFKEDYTSNRKKMESFLSEILENEEKMNKLAHKKLNT